VCRRTPGVQALRDGGPGGAGRVDEREVPDPGQGEQFILLTVTVHSVRGRGRDLTNRVDIDWRTS